VTVMVSRLWFLALVSAAEARQATLFRDSRNGAIFSEWATLHHLVNGMPYQKRVFQTITTYTTMFADPLGFLLVGIPPDQKYVNAKSGLNEAGRDLYCRNPLTALGLPASFNGTGIVAVITDYLVIGCAMNFAATETITQPYKEAGFEAFLAFTTVHVVLYSTWGAAGPYPAEMNRDFGWYNIGLYGDTFGTLLEIINGTLGGTFHLQMVDDNQHTDPSKHPLSVMYSAGFVFLYTAFGLVCVVEFLVAMWTFYTLKRKISTTGFVLFYEGLVGAWLRWARLTLLSPTLVQGRWSHLLPAAHIQYFWYLDTVVSMPSTMLTSMIWLKMVLLGSRQLTKTQDMAVLVIQASVCCGVFGVLCYFAVFKWGAQFIDLGVFLSDFTTMLKTLSTNAQLPIISIASIVIFIFMTANVFFCWQIVFPCQSVTVCKRAPCQQDNCKMDVCADGNDDFWFGVDHSVLVDHI